MIDRPYPAAGAVQAAVIRRRIRIPLRFADGYATTATARCDCGPQLREAVERITRHGGYVLYLRQEGRGGHDLLSRSLEHAAPIVVDVHGGSQLPEWGRDAGDSPSR